MKALGRKSRNRACVAKKGVLVCVDLKVSFKEMLHAELKKRFTHWVNHLDRQANHTM